MLDVPHNPVLCLRHESAKNCFSSPLRTHPKNRDSLFHTATDWIFLSVWSEAWQQKRDSGSHPKPVSGGTRKRRKPGLQAGARGPRPCVGEQPSCYRRAQVHTGSRPKNRTAYSLTHILGGDRELGSYIAEEPSLKAACKAESGSARGKELMGRIRSLRGSCISETQFTRKPQAWEAADATPLT